MVLTKDTPVSEEIPRVWATLTGTGDKDQICFLLYHINTPILHAMSSNGIRLPKVDLDEKINIYCAFDVGFWGVGQVSTN